MANLETQILDEVIVKSRRKMLSLGGAALAGLAVAGVTKANAQAATITDFDILNFALNLEYLEAQFYTLAVFGVTIDKLPTAIPISVNGGTGGTVAIKPDFAKVPFADTAIAAYAKETAIEEGKHVSFLQTALGSKAVSMPNIDLYGSFNTLAAAAGIGPAFDPFASDANFLIGAYIFEDVGVTAYHGAAPLISDKVKILPAAVGIHAVEAYHAGLVRISIARLDAGSGTLLGLTQKISATRSALANPGGKPLAVDDYGIINTTVALQNGGSYPVTTFVDVDISETSTATSYSRGFGRTTSQVIAIVTGGGAGNKGVFYPDGLNGLIK